MCHTHHPEWSCLLMRVDMVGDSMLPRAVTLLLMTSSLQLSRTYVRRRGVWQQQQTNKEKALKILSNEGVDPASYGVPQLNSLLAWHQVSVPPKFKKAEKLAMWREIVASLKPPPPYAKWTNEDELRLLALQSDVVGIGDTVLGREVALRKRELEAATLCFSREERQAMIQKLTDMNADEAGETRTDAITEGFAPI